MIFFAITRFSMVFFIKLLLRAIGFGSLGPISGESTALPGINKLVLNLIRIVRCMVANLVWRLGEVFLRSYNAWGWSSNSFIEWREVYCWRQYLLSWLDTVYAKFSMDKITRNWKIAMPYGNNRGAFRPRFCDWIRSNFCGMSWIHCCEDFTYKRSSTPICW